MLNAIFNARSAFREILNVASCEDLTCFHAYLSYSALRAASSKLNLFERLEESRSQSNEIKIQKLNVTDRLWNEKSDS